MSTDFKGYLLSEFLEDYEHGLLGRREALKLIAGLVGSVSAAGVLLAACSPPETGPATADQPSAADSTDESTAAADGQPQEQPGPQPTASQAEGIDEIAVAEEVTIPADGAELIGYWARPAGQGPFWAVLVCHENRGLLEHIKDVTRRVAAAGYVGLAVDLLSREGGTQAVDSSAVPGLLGNMPAEQFVGDFTAGWRWLQAKPEVIPTGAGMVGFCFGGGVTWRVAIGLPEIKAAVPFYGPHPDPDDLDSIQAAVLAIYAGRDSRINQSIPQIQARMAELNKIYETVVYPDVDHAFHNDTGSRYNAEAATSAWAHTLEWFGRYLVGG